MEPPYGSLPDIGRHDAGYWFGNLLTPRILDISVGASMIAMALRTLKPDTLDQDALPISAARAFAATLTSFFVAEIGDKTQIATLALLGLLYLGRALWR